MTALRFAVAGAPLKTPSPGGTIKGLHYAASLGIRAMEMEWVQQVPSNAKNMEEIRRTAEELDMTLTVHAPYYVNLNSPEPDTLEASIGRVIKALSMAEIAGARSVCVHAAFRLGQPDDVVYQNVRRAVDRILTDKDEFFPHVNLALETMGKPTQFGTLEEVLKISREFGLYPTLDPAHMHALSNGKWNTEAEWNAMFDQCEEYLGKSCLSKVHMHFSGILYGEKGEKKHLPLEESDADWRGFLNVLHDRKIGGTVVCESPAMEDDTILLQDTYANPNGYGASRTGTEKRQPKAKK